MYGLCSYEELGIVLQAVTKPAKSLALTFVLFWFIQYFFAIIGMRASCRHVALFSARDRFCVFAAVLRDIVHGI